MSEIGEIGAIYEDRRTKKQGKLIERDDKYKTLLMEASDGKSFNITFGGFKSNWRKVDEPEQTVEEAMQEEVPDEQITVDEPVKKSVRKKKNKKSIKSEDVNPVFADAVTLLVDYVNSFNSNQLNIKPYFDRDFIAIKIGMYKFIEVFRRPRTNHFIVACKEDVAKAVDKFKYIDGVKYYKTRKPLNYAFIVNEDNFDEFLKDFRTVVVAMLSANIEEE